MATSIVPAAPTLLDDLASIVRHLLHSRRHGRHWWTRQRRTVAAVLARVKPARQRLLFQDTEVMPLIADPGLRLFCGELAADIAFRAGVTR